MAGVRGIVRIGSRARFTSNSNSGLTGSTKKSFKCLQSVPVAPLQLIRPISFTATNWASKNNTDMAEFLKDEINAEKGNLKKLVAPGGQAFQVKHEGAELTFTKTDSGSGEKIVVSLNVNHTVDSAEPDDGSQEAPEMKSKPNFEVDIVKKDGKTLSFSCSYIVDDGEAQEGQAEEGMNDVFTIDEVTMFEGEDWTEKKYAVAGDILDGYLYDLFMTMLEERGIDGKFVEDMSDYCSAYEHSLYINLLTDLEKFVK